MATNKVKYGRVVLFGRPNTGKSTLLNALLGHKGAITSPQPQTTRKNRDYWIRSEEGGLMIITDTPGVMGKVEDTLGKKINLQPKGAMKSAQVVVGLYDLSREKNDEDNKTTGELRLLGDRVILFFNKSDKSDKVEKHRHQFDYLREEFETIEGSALQGRGIKELLTRLWERLPLVDPKTIAKMELSEVQSPGENAYEFVAEIIREKAYLGLREELPYSVTVAVTRITDKQKILVIEAKLITNQERYKKMIIGKNGQKIKEIGATARKELEVASGRKIYLELTVEIDRHWQEKELV